MLLIILIIILFIICAFLMSNVVNGGAVELPPGYTDASKIMGIVQYSGKKIVAYKKQNQLKHIFKDLPLNQNYEMKEKPWTGNGDSIIFKKKTPNEFNPAKTIDNGYSIQTKEDGGFVVWIRREDGKADDFIFALDPENKLVLTNGIIDIPSEFAIMYCPDLGLYKNVHGTYDIRFNQIKYYPEDKIIYLKSNSKKIFSITNKNNRSWGEVKLLNKYFKNPNIPHQCTIQMLFSRLPEMTDSKGKKYKIADMTKINDILLRNLEPLTTLSVNEQLFEFKKLDITEFPE